MDLLSPLIIQVGTLAIGAVFYVMGICIYNYTEIYVGVFTYTCMYRDIQIYRYVYMYTDILVY